MYKYKLGLRIKIILLTGNSIFILSLVMLNGIFLSSHRQFTYSH